MTGAAFPDRILQVVVSVDRPDTSAGAAPGATKTTTYTWQLNRIRVSIRYGGAQFGNAHITVYGVPLQDMNNIARLWLETMTPQTTDSVTVNVWNGQSFSPLFYGTITWSSVDASAMPAVALVLDANSGFKAASTPAAPYASSGPVSLKDALTTIATQAGYTVNYAASAPNYMVTTRVTGSALDQIAALMRHFPDLTWVPVQQQILVRAALAPQFTDPVRIAVDTGMQGAPVYSTSGLQIATLFNPLIIPGTALNVVTAFDFVNRTQWVAHVLAHELDANMPGGQWTTSIAANAFGANGNNNGNAPAV